MKGSKTLGKPEGMILSEMQLILVDSAIKNQPNSNPLPYAVKKMQEQQSDFEMKNENEMKKPRRDP